MLWLCPGCWSSRFSTRCFWMRCIIPNVGLKLASSLTTNLLFKVVHQLMYCWFRKKGNNGKPTFKFGTTLCIYVCFENKKILFITLYFIFTKTIYVTIKSPFLCLYSGTAQASRALRYAPNIKLECATQASDNAMYRAGQDKLGCLHMSHSVPIVFRRMISFSLPAGIPV